ncbi:prenyltransferase [Fructilactobacillus myrtifloralis]|uniref:Prenyltransferase n=1 Tax=Fructilactobacillus myrtifloralis TaxID=2940301 RepID=A0ABY5BMB1_9LACO|nr:prenyltransferase [Fructilactobacillus myrtifloralis]USS84649.1 prenyltransferase [Fructilactobacillus myrtifloralis]
MKTWHRLLRLTRVHSLIASVLPFCLGLLFALFRDHEFNWGNSLLFFLITCLMQILVNLFDTYQDFQNALKYQLSPETDDIFAKVKNKSEAHRLKLAIYGLTALGGLLALWLVLRTSPVILGLGLLGTAVGYLYSGGPHPIQNGPAGDVASGLIMGYIITLATVLINIQPAQYHWALVGEILLVAGIAICAITNISLANNLCDYEEDVKFHRFTSVSYLGKEGTLRFYACNYLLGYGCLLAAICLGWLPVSTCLVFVTIPLVIKNTRRFWQVQSKQQTFVLTIRNDIAITLAVVVATIIFILFQV